MKFTSKTEQIKRQQAERQPSSSRFLKDRCGLIATVCVLLSLLMPASAALAQAFGSQSDVASGRRLYEQGLQVDGTPLLGLGAGGMRIASHCSDCHRRSGMGGSEGNRRVPPITSMDLFNAPATLAVGAPGDRPARTKSGAATAAPTRRMARAAYTDATLARAIREGIDASGRPLHALMPRYAALDDASMQALVAYLKTLYSTPAPGWHEGLLHLSTVITPEATPAQTRALTGVLQHWAAQRPWLRLHVWTLHGEPATWSAQLASRLEQQPVFAVLSGAGGSHWREVHDFCETRALPCVLPLVDAPPPSGAAADAPATHWSVYFSAGLRLEAQALAQTLKTPGQPRPKRVVQWVEAGAAEAGAQALIQALADDPDSRIPVETHAWTGDSDALRAELARLDGDDTLIAWLQPQALQALWLAWPQHDASSGPAGEPGRIVMAGSLAGFDALPPQALRARTTMISVELDPLAMRGRTALGLLPWARQASLVIDDERLQAKAYAAAGFMGDALARMQRRIDREYLLETLERAIDSRPYAGPYLSLSLGPAQRLAGKSAQWLTLGGPEGDRWIPGATRITP